MGWGETTIGVQCILGDSSQSTVGTAVGLQLTVGTAVGLQLTVGTAVGLQLTVGDSSRATTHCGEQQSGYNPL